MLYTADIKNAAAALDLGAINIQVRQVFLSNFDTDAIYTGLKAKIESGEALSDEDTMRFLILPLTQPDKKRKQMLIKDTVNIAKQIKDDEQQAFILAGILTATNKFIDPNYAKTVKEWLGMLKVVRLIIEDALEEAMEETAKKLLGHGAAVDVIADCTSIPESRILQIKENIMVEKASA